MSQETAPGIAGMTHQESLYGKTPDQLAALCGELGMPRFAARQIARWLYVRHTEDPLRMTDMVVMRISAISSSLQINRTTL